MEVLVNELSYVEFDTPNRRELELEVSSDGDFKGYVDISEEDWNAWIEFVGDRPETKELWLEFWGTRKGNKEGGTGGTSVFEQMADFAASIMGDQAVSLISGTALLAASITSILQ